MGPDASIIPEYALMSLNMLEYSCILLNVPEYAWKCMNKLFYVRAINMPQYGYYNTIIIVMNVIILEFLSARFVHPGALLPFYHFLKQVRT